MTLLLLPKSIPAEREYVPAFKNTTWLAGQDWIAELICAEVAPGFKVEQIVLRTGMPPGIPTLDQSTEREGSIGDVPGGGGGGGGVTAWVVAEAEEDWVETFPAPSTAATVYE